MSTKAGGSDHPFLFTYANSFILDLGFVVIVSIYLFIYSKWCQQKQVEPTTCFYLLMQIASCYGWIACCYCWLRFNYSPNFLNIFFNSHFRKILNFVTNWWRGFVQCCKIPICKQRVEMKWMSSLKLIFGFNIFWRLNSKLLRVH